MSLKGDRLEIGLIIVTKMKVENFRSRLISNIDFNFGRHKDLSTRKSDISGR